MNKCTDGSCVFVCDVCSISNTSRYPIKREGGEKERERESAE